MRYLLMVVSLVLVWASLVQAEPFRGKVVAISDGDTLTVLRGKKTLKIRLMGVDAPEKQQAFGTHARQMTSDLVFGKTVTVYPSAKPDRYGRVLAHIILPSGQSLSHLLVHTGLAWWYVAYAKDMTMLAVLEAEARQAQRGLWSDPHAVAPWEWRRGKD